MGATNCPETPRQKMITMMYLVYTAMLALNVSAEVVEGFRSVGSAMTNSNINLQEKLDDTYTNFDAAYQNSPDKVRDSYNKAQEVKKLSNELCRYIDSLEYEFIGIVSKDEAIIRDVNDPKKARTVQLKTDGATNHDSVRLALQLGGFSWMEKGLDNTHEAPNFFLIGRYSADGEGYAKKLKEKVIAYRQQVKEILGEDSSKVNFPFDVEKMFLNKEKKPVDWEHKNFDEVVAGAGLITLIRMKAETMNSEFDAVNMLYKQISKGDFSFDKVQLISRPKKSYVVSGETYETEIYVGAYNTKEDFVVKINGQDYHSVDGVVTYKAGGTTPGPKTIRGIATLKSPDGTTVDGAFDDDYYVAEPMGSIQLDNMMVLYAGVENPITVSGAGVDNRNIEVTADGCSVTTVDKAKGTYLIKPANANKKTASIKLTAHMPGGKNFELADTKVRIKPIPTPELKIGGIPNGGTVARNTLASSNNVQINMGKDFLLKIDPKLLQIVQMTVMVGNRPIGTYQGRTLNAEVVSAIKRASNGDMFIVKAQVRKPDMTVEDVTYFVTLK